MKQHLVTAIICQGLLSSVTAVPLTQLIIQENDKLKVKIEAYKKQCGGKQANDEKCTKRRYELSGDLGKFVALANEELALLNPANLSPDIPASDRQQFMARRRQIEQMVRVTLDAMKSLGSPDSNSKSSTESAALVATTADDSARIEAQTKLKDEIEKALGKSYRSVPRVWDVQITGQAIKVRFSIQDNLTEGLIKGSARSDSRKILQTAQSAGYPYSEITAVGTFAMKDKFGNSHEDEVVRVTYTRSTVDKINWAGFLTDNMYDIADTLWRARSFQ